MSQTIGMTKLAYARTWHHVSCTTPHHALTTIRPIPAADSPLIQPPPLGRLASRMCVAQYTYDLQPFPRGSLCGSCIKADVPPSATLLMGKHKPIWDPSTDCGDYVVVTNCSHLHTTGKKRWQKMYYRHNTRPGSLKQVTMDELMAKLGGAEVLRKAVAGMLPKNRLRDDRMNRLKAFEGEAHPHKGNIVKFLGVPKIATWPKEEAKK